MKRIASIGIMAALPWLFAILTVAPTSLEAQTTPSVSLALSPGPHLPTEMPLTGDVTLQDLDPAAYPSFVLRADVTGHEDRTRHCYGDDTGADIEVEVDETREIVSGLQLFKSCTNAPGSFGTYGYVLTVTLFGGR